MNYLPFLLAVRTLLLFLNVQLTNHWEFIIHDIDLWSFSFLPFLEISWLFNFHWLLFLSSERTTFWWKRTFAELCFAHVLSILTSMTKFIKDQSNILRTSWWTLVCDFCKRSRDFNLWKGVTTPYANYCYLQFYILRYRT